MPRARDLLRRLQRDGWRTIRRGGSHRTLVRGDRQGTWAYHDGQDLGNSNLRDIAETFGYTVEQLRDL